MWTNKPILLLDGATGTELGRRGADISLPLWSAKALIERPDLLEQIHRDYLLAGADAITACTFRTHQRSLAKAKLGSRAAELTRKAVDIARTVRDAINPQARVLGSVAPLEDCYEPELAPTATECAAEHAQQINNLIDAGVDGIVIETMNNLHESAAAAKEAERIAPGKWMISFCTKSDGPPGMLLSGESITDLIPVLQGASAIGVNCVAGPSTEAQVKLLRLLVPEHIRISAYANVSKATPEGAWVSTDAVDPEIYAQYAARWVNAGASIIGGCCGTRPEMIRAIASHLAPNADRA
jgi:S-methylmethionine-dependent homocysteine/selenocysteine methylase